jgi:hypothetical protein
MGTVETVLRRVTPKLVKQVVWATRDAGVRWGIRLRALRRRRRLQRGLERRDLETLVWAWGNEYSATPEFLAVVTEAVRRTEGPVLECGSGLTTLVLGMEADGKGLEVYSLEHDPHWAKETRRALKRHGVHARVLDAPLRSYGAFEWYHVPELPDTFSLVVCDGPPAGLCGRYGLVPVLGDRIRGEVLVDDADRPDEQEVLSRWESEFGLEAEISGTYARIAVGPVAPSAEATASSHVPLARERDSGHAQT